MTVRKGEAVIGVTKTDAKLTHRTLGLIVIDLEDSSSPSEQGIHEGDDHA
jgi:hypothetical protein